MNDKATNHQRKTLKELQKLWKTLVQYSLKNYKKFWLLRKKHIKKCGEMRTF